MSNQIQNKDALPATTPTEKSTILKDRYNTIKKLSEVMMKKMDRFAFARSLTVFALMAFFLGNNLGIYLWFYVVTSIYLLVYRGIRFWVKRWLMYIMEFCYFGNSILICFVLFTGQNKNIFYIAYICSTGVMAMAAVIFNNQARFNNTDHLTSAFIHTLPLITSWALRWRHKIYHITSLSNYGFNILEVGDIKFSECTEFNMLIVLPIIFWACWALLYFIFTSTFLNKYAVDEKYASGINDFVHAKLLSSVLGDHSKYRHIKYLFEHLLFFIISLPIAVISYYSFTFNTIFLMLIIIFLGWNTGRNEVRQLERSLEKAEKKVASEENINTDKKLD
jgi:hypothetical protein